MRRYWQIALFLILTVATLGLALWGADPRAIALAFRGFQWSLLAPVAALYTMVAVVRSARLRALIDPEAAPRPSLARVFTIAAVGMFAIQALPLRLGELVRPYLLRERCGVPFGAGVAAVALERVCDLIGLATVIALAGASGRIPPGGVTVGGVDLLTAGARAISTSAIGAVIFVLALGAVGPVAIEAVAVRLDAPVPLAAKVLRGLFLPFASGIRGLASRPTDALTAVVCTGLVWIGSVGGCWVLLHGFPALPADVAAAGINMAATITAVVIAPSPVGPFEAGSVASLVALGADPDTARAFAIAHHTATVGYNAIVGGIALLAEGWSLAALVRASRDPEKLA